MRALVIFLFVLGAVAFMARCGSEVTEIEWTNASSSTATVNAIEWQQNSQVIASWNSSNGWAPGSTTDAKEVTETTGTMECAIFDGTTPTTGEVKFGSSADSLVLQGQSIPISEGSTNNLIIQALKDI